MPDESRSAPGRIVARLRRRHDAELLALAPAVDEDGKPLVWDFAHPVNRSPAWRLLRPWVLVPSLTAVGLTAIGFVTRRGVPPLAELGGDVLFSGIVCTLLGLAIRRHSRPSTERAALKAYRLYRWRATTTMDAAIAAALERERTPQRLVDAPAAPER